MHGYLRTGCYIYSLFAASTIALLPSVTLATNRPVHLATLTLLCTSSLLFFYSCLTKSVSRVTEANRGQYELIPLHNHEGSTVEIVKEKRRVNPSPLNSKALVLIVLCAAVALTIRVEIQRRVLISAECATRSKEVWLPLLLVPYDAIRFQQLEPGNDTTDRGSETRGIRHSIAKLLRAFVLFSRWRYLPTVSLLSLGCYLVTGLWWYTDSTFICPLVSSDALTIPSIQWLALFLDVVLAISAVELSLGGIQPARALLATPTSWAVAALTSAGSWIIISLVVYNTQPENRAWLLATLERFPVRTLFHLLCQAAFLSTFCASALYSVANQGLLNVSMVLTSILILIPGLRFVWFVNSPYPPLSSVNSTWSFVLVYTAWALFTYTRAVARSSERTFSTIWRFVVVVTLFVLHVTRLLRSNIVLVHPIDRLISDAQSTHASYVHYATQSRNLADAVRVYEERYHDTPPAGFDDWFKFASDRSVLLIDEFDQIHNDLFPFRAIPPSQLREQTWELISNPWNGVSGISIRNGRATVQENVIPTHRWMLEGVVRMLENFSQYLPDMDVAFNLNDECRVAVPYEELQTLEKNALLETFEGISPFSSSRSPGWRDIAQESTNETVFEDWSFRNSFQEWSSPTCPPGSAARNQRLYKSQLCVTCAAEHTHGQFISNWSAAADPCGQPDLAFLHGFYLSPAAFKTTRHLRPVFSQSKAKGFNDIIYPSAWNYIDKVIYAPTDKSTDESPALPDPQYSDKESTLFWRGATSEGISDGHGTWRGMTRQRTVHMANNLTKVPGSKEILLLPTSDSQHFQYAKVPRSSLSKLGLVADTHFVNEITRCGGRDCVEQANELGLVEPTPFQGHWKYKYLIDLDGAGFSGRFLPFLQSRSLPFKAALFREWYDSRLTPWLHFVPIDLRLHGLWSTLAYFNGLRGSIKGREVNWNGHEAAGELIAEAGREWSQRVLTKADMEVYLFRLLLEWGRLTDDRRGEIGFAAT